MTCRRLLALTSIVTLLLVAAVPAAMADDLEDYLEQAAEATYAGQQATWCSFSGATEFSVVSVEYAGSKLMVENGDSSQILEEGRVTAVDSGNGVALYDWSSVPLADRYVTSAVTSEVRLGRDVVVVTVAEDGEVRAQIWFDDSTGAALGSEIFDEDGELFRLSWMIDFDPNPRRIYLAPGASSYDVVVGADANDFKATLAGYELVDTYRGPNSSTHGFYSDGLFSFSLFVVDGEGTTTSFVEAQTMKVGSGTYRWILTASELWVQWSASGRTFVLVGDLPPDHLEQVLTELPVPGGSFFSRIWNGLFG